MNTSVNGTPTLASGQLPAYVATLSALTSIVASDGGSVTIIVDMTHGNPIPAGVGLSFGTAAGGPATNTIEVVTGTNSTGVTYTLGNQAGNNQVVLTGPIAPRDAGLAQLPQTTVTIPFTATIFRPF